MNTVIVYFSNFGHTQRVAEACTEAGCAMMFLSTTSVYGTQEAEVDENCAEDDLKPQSPYAQSKLSAEKHLQDLAAAGKLDSCICRLGTIFGTSIGMRFHTAVKQFRFLLLDDGSCEVQLIFVVSPRSQKMLYLAGFDPIYGAVHLLDNLTFRSLGSDF